MEFYYSRDLRDFFMPAGGASRLTLRKLLVLVDRLPEDSAFVSAVRHQVPISPETSLLMDIHESLTGTAHGRRDALERAEEKVRRDKLIEQERKRARARRERLRKHT